MILSRDAMVLLEASDGDREVRAVLVDGRLYVGVYERYQGQWVPDSESGISLYPDGVAALRRLLGERPDRPCADCGDPADDECPGCHKLVCRVCAEREGETCCDGNGGAP